MNSKLTEMELHTDVLGRNTCKRLKKDWTEGGFTQNVVATEASDNPTAGCGAEMALQSCPKLRRLGWTFVFLHQTLNSYNQTLPPAPWAVVGSEGVTLSKAGSLWLKAVSRERQL